MGPIAHLPHDESRPSPSMKRLWGRLAAAATATAAAGSLAVRDCLRHLPPVATRLSRLGSGQSCVDRFMSVGERALLASLHRLSFFLQHTNHNDHTPKISNHRLIHRQPKLGVGHHSERRVNLGDVAKGA